MKILFYLVSSRGTKRHELFSIAKRTATNKKAMDDFLLAWAKKSHCWDSSENHISYGYEVPTKTKRFILTSKRIDLYRSKIALMSQFLSKTAATKMMKKKENLEKWYEKRGILLFPRRYSLMEVM